VDGEAIENMKHRKKAEYYDEVTKSLQKESEEMAIIREVREMSR